MDDSLINIIITAIISAALSGIAVYGVQSCKEKRKHKRNKKKLTALVKSDVKTVEVLIEAINNSDINTVPKHVLNRLLSKQASWYELKRQAIEYLDLEDIESLTDLYWVIETSVIMPDKKGIVTLSDKQIKLIVQSIDALKNSFNR